MAPVGGVSISDLLAGYVALPSVAVTAQAAWTLEGRVRLRSLPANLQALAAEASSANSTSVMLGVNSSGFAVLLSVESGGGAANLGGSVNLADGAEHHLAATLVGTVLSLYVDGVVVGTATKPGTFAPNTTTIGARRTASVDRVLNGRAAGVRLWTRALTAAEIADRSLGREISRAGLVADLPLDEGVGTKALDRSDVPLYDGTLTGAIAWLQPKAARGLRSSGSGGRVDARLPAVVAQVAFSAVARVRNARTTDAAYASILNVNNAASGLTGRALLQRYATADALLLQMGTGAGQIQLLSVGKWAGDYHVALTFDGATARGYQDGALIGSAAGTVTPGAILPDVTFGGGTSGQDFSVGDVAYYSRALSALEIRALTLGADPLSIEGCVAYFPLGCDTLNRAPVTARRKNYATNGGTSGASVNDPNALTSPTPSNWGTAGAVAGTQGWDARTGSFAAILNAPSGHFILASAFVSTPVDMAGKPITFRIDAVATPDVVGTVVQLHSRVRVFDAAGAVLLSYTNGPVLPVDDQRWTEVAQTLTLPASAASVEWSIVKPGTETATVRIRRASIAAGTSTVFVDPTEREPSAAVHGTPVNSPRLVRPRARDGVRGPGQFAVARTAALAASYASSFSLASWVRPWSPAAALIVVDDDAGGAQGFGIEANLAQGSRFVAYVLSGSFPVVGPVIDRAWHHVCVTYDRPTGTFSFFVDGILYGSRVATIGASVYTTTFLRAFQGQSHITSPGSPDAQVADLQWISGALTADEVAALVAGIPPTRARLVGEWLTPGSIVGAVALDTSGNGAHGALAGGAVAA